MTIHGLEVTTHTPNSHLSFSSENVRGTLPIGDLDFWTSEDPDNHKSRISFNPKLYEVTIPDRSSVDGMLEITQDNKLGTICIDGSAALSLRLIKYPLLGYDFVVRA